jgi:hypothetical protein
LALEIKIQDEIVEERKEESGELFENEWYIVRYSGETPEIAYNSAIYFLTRAADGPGMSLLPAQLNQLRQAAVDRYEEIVLRDLYHENVGKPIYRGVARSICNYQRFIRFCQRQGLCHIKVKSRCTALFAMYLKVELERTCKNGQYSVINCSFAELKSFAVALNVSFLTEYSALKSLCPESE